METDRRSKGNQVPQKLDGVLNDQQFLTLIKMERFGWMLAFIRRPLFQDIIPVLHHPDRNILGTLDGEGALNLLPGIKFRQ